MENGLFWLARTEGQIGTGLMVLILASVLVPLFYRRRYYMGPIAFILTLIGSAFLISSGVSVFLQGPTSTFHLHPLPGLTTPLTIGVDYLSAVFLIFVPAVVTLVCLYSLSYIENYKEQNPARLYPFLILLPVAAALIVIAADLILFLIGWELLALITYFFIVYRKEKEVVRAGAGYLLVSQAAIVCLIGATLILYRFSETKNLTFEAVGQTIEQMGLVHPGWLHTALFLFLIGFGINAGIFPFHFWLRKAYPSAPSAAAGALAAVGPKVAVYALLRLYADWLPVSFFSTIWGQILALFGGLSLFVGAFIALLQTDAAKLVSCYITVQLGYIVLAIGAGVTFLPISPPIALVALTAGLFHTVNNALYKSLLFLNTGALFARAGETDLAKVGGLMRVMPLTGLTALTAAVAIAGLPPVNGFASKWMIFSDCLMAGRTLPLFALLGAIALFISALTLASFLKFFGSAFLGPLMPATAEKKDLPLPMQVPQALLAVACVLIGLAPAAFVLPLYQAVSFLLHKGYAPSPYVVLGDSLTAIRLNFGDGIVATWNPIPFLAAGAVTFLVSFGLYRLLNPSRRVSPVWHCGATVSPTIAKYHTHGFYQPFKDFVGFRVNRSHARSHNPSAYASEEPPVRPITQQSQPDRLYPSVIRWISRLYRTIRRTRNGSPPMVWMLLTVSVIVAIALYSALS
ncbi:MAG: hypothetical protein NZ959_07670 [Armatimonadetes bacterium]|nr:hypothetical protein [Armatimonadota bacterium]MDW8122390.1 proton-conducting transporter membrane subunit [Armatimonadota bacterium]